MRLVKKQGRIGCSISSKLKKSLAAQPGGKLVLDSAGEPQGHARWHYL
jgi:hypothetical protein